MSETSFKSKVEQSLNNVFVDYIQQISLRYNISYDELLNLWNSKENKNHLGDKDENITFSQLKELIGNDKADYIYNKSMELYNYAHGYALSKGLCLIDTKF